MFQLFCKWIYTHFCGFVHSFKFVCGSCWNIQNRLYLWTEGVSLKGMVAWCWCVVLDLQFQLTNFISSFIFHSVLFPCLSCFQWRVDCLVSHIICRTTAYTNQTVLHAWSFGEVELGYYAEIKLLPRHVEIIETIDGEVPHMQKKIYN